MIADNLYGLKDVQTQLLESVRAFHNCCRENGIDYSAYGGTMLGAVREKGFIPWDDDVDVFMSMPNYEKLQQALKNNEDYFLDTQDTWVPRFRSRKNPTGPFVDVFIIVPVPPKSKKTLTVMRLRVLQGMLKKYQTVRKVSFIYKVLLVGSRMLGKLFSRKYLLRRYWKIAYGKTYESDRLYVPNRGFSYLPLEYSKQLLDEGFEDMDFEDMKIQVYKAYDHILTIDYDENYMTPVSEADRAGTHQQQIKQ